MADRPTEGPSAKGRLKAAWTLALLAPVSAELTLGVTPLQWAWLVLPVVAPMYGACVLLIRELVRRVRGGWPSLLLLGMAYELIEDGVALQALTSPVLYDAAEWGPRLLGFNTTYWQAQSGYHVVFSVLIPIMLTDLLFPAHRNRPYLKPGGLVGVAVTAVLGVALVRAFIPPSVDPGYQAPVSALAVIVSVAAVLALVALLVLPGGGPAPVAKASSPAPPAVGVLAALAVFGYMALLFPFDLTDPPAFGDGTWMPVPMALAAVLALVTGWYLYRWSLAGNWGDRHRIWVSGGALVSHSVFGLLVFSAGPVDHVGMVVIIVLTVALLAALARRRERYPAFHSEEGARSLPRGRSAKP